MKLGASYNLFDGEELLKDSLLSIRDNTDYISIVYQTQSNYGNLCNPQITDMLIQYQKNKLIDEVVHFIPDLNKKASENELLKRNIGLTLSKEKKCTHHLSIDTDELYEKRQFANAKSVIEQGDYDSSACRLYTYYKNQHTVLHPMEDYYVSFIYKIRDNLYFDTIPFQVLVDPTRRMPQGKLKVFKITELTMHHYSYVRKDIRVKLENSSAKQNFSTELIDELVMHYNSWQPGMQAMIAPKRYFDVLKIDPKFNLSWED